MRAPSTASTVTASRAPSLTPSAMPVAVSARLNSARLRRVERMAVTLCAVVVAWHATCAEADRMRRRTELAVRPRASGIVAVGNESSRLCPGAVRGVLLKLSKPGGDNAVNFFSRLREFNFC
jgi:hypothetical protein